MSSQEYIRSITEIVPDDFPTLTPLSENVPESSNSYVTWIIIILILALLGINIFAYLAKGTEEVASIFEQIFGPILRLFGYTALETTKQTIETTAEGTKTGVDIVANTTTGVIDTAVQGTNASSLQSQKIQGNNIQRNDQWQNDSLVRALDNAKQNDDVSPDESRSSIQTSGKSGWCYIGEEQGIRTCAEIGVNDVCMSGDVFPNQAICMNPNLRA